MRGSLSVEAYQVRRSARGVGIKALGAMAWTSIIKVATMCDEKKPKKAIRGIPSIAFIVCFPTEDTSLSALAFMEESQHPPPHWA
eukprot:scaffold1953_cov176-Amphora_coffeaeformis.AAC.16